MRDDKYRGLEDTIKSSLSGYWNSCNIDSNSGHGGIGDFMAKLYGNKAAAGPYWVQCDNCVKWRRVQTSPELLKADVSSAACHRAGANALAQWTCALNTDTRFNSCSIPQQADEAIQQLEK
jgi:hypothetical protein